MEVTLFRHPESDIPFSPSADIDQLEDADLLGVVRLADALGVSPGDVRELMAAGLLKPAEGDTKVSGKALKKFVAKLVAVDFASVDEAEAAEGEEGAEAEEGEAEAEPPKAKAKSKAKAEVEEEGEGEEGEEAAEAAWVFAPVSLLKRLFRMEEEAAAPAPVGRLRAHSNPAFVPPPHYPVPPPHPTWPPKPLPPPHWLGKRPSPRAPGPPTPT